MARLSRIRRCQRLSRNARGRDLVVGDLHGHRSLFEAQLDRLGFDPSCDRVLSVGDLIDRGPDSLATLSLLDEPWFHAVLGNHELMLLNYLGYYSSRIHSCKSFPNGGGQWINEAVSKHRKKLARLADLVAELPLALHVDDQVAFNVMHGDLLGIGSRQEMLFSEGTVCVHEADGATSSRLNFGEALGCGLVGLGFDEHRVQISERPFGDLRLTYVGHSPVRDVTVHNSYIYIDQGVCARPARQGGHRPPTVLDHRQFSHWLEGVSIARGRVTAGAASDEPDRRPRTVQCDAVEPA